MIAYCKPDAQAAFAALSDVLDKAAATELAGDKPIAGDCIEDALLGIVEADPDANAIRKAFEAACGIAARAGDTKTERELRTRYAGLLERYGTIATSDDPEDAAAAYRQMLRADAAWFRAFVSGIDDAGKRTDAQADADTIARDVSEAVTDLLKRDFGKIKDNFRDVQADAKATRIAAERNGETLRDIQADTTAAAMSTATIKNGVEFLVEDRQKKRKANRARGMANQEKGNAEERESAAKDMDAALRRVHKRMKGGATNCLQECRIVCAKFKPLTTKKNVFGEFESYAPLTRADGEAIKPETLAKNYRERWGTKKAKKAKTKAAAPKRRTE